MAGKKSIQNSSQCFDVRTKGDFQPGCKGGHVDFHKILCVCVCTHFTNLDNGTEKTLNIYRNAKSGGLQARWRTRLEFQSMLSKWRNSLKTAKVHPGQVKQKNSSLHRQNCTREETVEAFFFRFLIIKLCRHLSGMSQVELSLLGLHDNNLNSLFHCYFPW